MVEVCRKSIETFIIVTSIQLGGGLATDAMQILWGIVLASMLPIGPIYFRTRATVMLLVVFYTYS